MALDVADSVARSMASAISMRRNLWLSQEVQQSIQDLPFEGKALFSEQMDTRLHRLKDSCIMLRSLGLYMPQADISGRLHCLDSRVRHRRVPTREGRDTKVLNVVPPHPPQLPSWGPCDTQVAHGRHFAGAPEDSISVWP